MSLAYTGCEDRPGRCSNILAAAALPRHQQLLSPGTTYTVGNLGASGFFSSCINCAEICCHI